MLTDLNTRILNLKNIQGRKLKKACLGFWCRSKRGSDLPRKLDCVVEGEPGVDTGAVWKDWFAPDPGLYPLLDCRQRSTANDFSENFLLRIGVSTPDGDIVTEMWKKKRTK